MHLEKRVSIYSNARDNVGTAIYLKDMGYVGSPQLKKMVEELRSETDTKKKDQLKKKFPAVTFSGLFEKRNAQSLVQYTGLICIDIDKLEPHLLPLLKKQLKKDPFTFLLFTSVSGNGLKVVFWVNDGPEMHLDNFIKVEAYFRDKYKIDIDKSGKDICRLCFLSYDEDAYLNENPKPFLYEIPQNTTIVEPSHSGSRPAHIGKPGGANGGKGEKKETTLEWVKAHTDKKYSFTPGNRSNYTYKFSVNALKYGFELTDVLNFALREFVDHSGEHPHTEQEVTATVKSAFNNPQNQLQHGSLIKGQGPSQRTGGSYSPLRSLGSSAATIDNHQAEQKSEEFIQFWIMAEEETRSGKVIRRYTIHYNRLIDFLASNGFHRLPMKEGYQFIHFHNNICRPVKLHNIKDFVFQFLLSKNFDEVLNLMRKGSNKYFSQDIIEGLPYKNITFKRSTEKESFFYFRNCFVKVTPVSLTTHPYEEMQGAIWQSQVIERDFYVQEQKLPVNKDGFFEVKKFSSEIAQYVSLIAHNPDNKEVDAKTSIERFMSVCSSIGYMLHDHKNRLAKAIVAVDHKIPEDKSEQNGGTGKSIIGSSFKYLKRVYFVDGREFDEKNQFKYTDLNIDHKIIAIQDCKQNLDFGYFFVPITQDFSYRAMYVGNVTIPFEDSPKFWFDSNFTFKGDGPSFRRRMHVIEFDDFFNDTNTPLDYFDHFLFDDWDNQEWNNFYNFYFYCVQLYLDQGLIQYPNSNYDSRRLLVESPVEFIDWLEAKNELNTYSNVKRNAWFEKKAALQAWNTEAKELNMQTVSPHVFSKWIKKYCRTKKIRFESKKTNGKELYAIYESDFTGSAAESGFQPQTDLFDKSKAIK